MHENQRIAESLELGFARQELKELREKVIELQGQLSAAHLEIRILKDSSQEKSERIRELEINLLKFVEGFLSDYKPPTNLHQEKEAQSKTKDAHNKGRRKRSSSGQGYQGYPLVLYFIYCEPAQAVKIGYTSDIRSRVSSIQVGNPFRLKLLGCIPIPDRLWEATVHKIFDSFWITGEWFAVNSTSLEIIKEVVRETSRIKAGLEKRELTNIISSWIETLAECIANDLTPKEIEDLRQNRKRVKTVKLLEEADSYLLSLPPISISKQKSLNPKKV